MDSLSFKELATNYRTAYEVVVAPQQAVFEAFKKYVTTIKTFCKENKWSPEDKKYYLIRNSDFTPSVEAPNFTDEGFWVEFEYEFDSLFITYDEVENIDSILVREYEKDLEARRERDKIYFETKKAALLKELEVLEERNAND